MLIKLAEEANTLLSFLQSYLAIGKQEASQQYTCIPSRKNGRLSREAENVTEKGTRVKK